MMLWVALAGGMGAAGRFLLDSWIVTRVRHRVPLGTIVINLLGSFVLGLLVGHFGHSSDWAKVVGTGAMGGFTTFSTASVESARLLLDAKATRSGRGMGLLHGLGMLVGAVLLAALGYAIGG